eukprot:gene11697-24497_t
MADSTSIKEWMYIDLTGTIKGPIPTLILSRLLEKNLGVSSETLIWKAGMEKWCRMAEVEQFSSMAAFQSMQWFYLEPDGQQRGPVTSRLLVHKLKEGNIDGLTLVYTTSIGEWKKLSEVAILKEAMHKVAQEEEAEAQALAAVSSTQQVFTGTTPDASIGIDIPQTSIEGIIGDGDGNGKGTHRRTFRADNGLRYIWDDAENGWVEDEDQESKSDDEEEDEETLEAAAKPVVKKGGNGGGGDGKGMYSSKGSNDVNVHAVQHTQSDRTTGEVNGGEGKDVNGEGDEGGDGVDDEEEEEAEDKTDIEGIAEKDADMQKRKRKRKNRKKANAGPNLWIYITGLPRDVALEEVKSHFSKVSQDVSLSVSLEGCLEVGLIAINPLDQKPKIKVYMDETGAAKGDCSLCYNAEESVQMALEVLDGGYIRPNCQITIKRADFGDKLQQGNSSNSTSTSSSEMKRSRPGATRAQLKVARSAMAQALAWNEEDDIGISKKQGLKIVVLEGMFTPSDFEDPAFSDELEKDVASECEKCGELEKITVFSRNPRGVVIVKFKTTFASQECIRVMDGRFFGGRRLRCYYWDGSTNFSIVSSAAEEEGEKEDLRRLDEFGDWLEKEQEELPDEFKLVEEGS